jgi:hypothetical protein
MAGNPSIFRTPVEPPGKPRVFLVETETPGGQLTWDEIQGKWDEIPGLIDEIGDLP